MQFVKRDYKRNLSAPAQRNRGFLLSMGFAVPFIIMSTQTVQAAVFISIALTASILLGQLLYSILACKLSVKKLIACGICSVAIAGVITFINMLIGAWLPMISTGSNRYVYLLCAIPSFLSMSDFDTVSFSKGFLNTVKLLLLFSVLVVAIAFVRELLTVGIKFLPNIESALRLSSAGYPFFTFVLCGYITALLTVVFNKGTKIPSDEEAA